MTSSRSRTPDRERESQAEPTDEAPELNCYEIHADRIVFTEPGNTDGWIATDETVTIPE